MPEVCRFHGLTIQIHPHDHDPPHFHAVYGDAEAMVDIEALMIMRGSLPPRLERQVLEWAALRQRELRDAWARARRHDPIHKIPPPA